MKRILTILSMVLISALIVSGCNSGSDDEYTIGLGQFGPHGSLDNCREGFLAGLAEEGIVEGENLTVDYQDANFDGGTTNLIAQSFVSKNVDLICAIATPMAQAAFNAAEGKDIPVIFTAVTDPVMAQINEGNITGTSDMLPVDAQLKLIRAIMPEATKIGILYTTSEVNSESAIAVYEELATGYGFEIVKSGISVAADIPLAIDGLLSKVDCISNLTDNTVVGSLPIILEAANAKNIPVFGSEIEQVKIGCAAAEGLEYYELGKQTGKMAARVLKGEATASEIPYEIIEESFLYVNSDVMEEIGLTLPSEMSGRAIDVA
ncbi:MAG: ABC transporter substrate-binding protein [Dehalococcoidales bacterium]|nr:ABC transporter substrate-binding protein [Dehalococcoidales bacterium]MDD4322705.1 ABC transporter substrate-binding protein [Dehalococcoidales bacterium]MDD4794276.1 ABC transporter substrate-binding protein [Dehalococcoidales bacterium]MDD5498931.1 ABC transporter substrate-binding protein [Dehalococcoidales bacterium]MDX9803428.1 ABC transporter substrate-binding protein [Dehalococcoidales bacterium]